MASAFAILRPGVGGAQGDTLGTDIDTQPPPEEDPTLVGEVRALQIINETGALIASQLDLNDLVRAVVDAGVELSGAEFGAFFYNVPSEDGEQMLLYALSGAAPERFSGYPHPRATPVFAPTFHGEGVVRSDDITKDPRYGHMAPHFGMPAGHPPVRSYLAVPVVSRSQEVLGGLFFGHAEPARFSARDERVISGIAAQAAIAIDNARLYEAARVELARRRATEATLVETDRRLNAVLNNATVSIFLMDGRQHCIYLNAAAERLTGFTLTEMDGRPLHDVIHHTRPDGSPFPLHECAIDRAFPENDRQQGEEVFVHKDGHFYPVAFTASPVRNDAGGTVGTVIEVRDISQEKLGEEARTMLMREVDHRARNALAVVQSLVKLTEAPDTESYKTKLFGRISALARAQGSLAERRWEGASLRDIVCEELVALCPAENFDVRGPDVLLRADQAQPVSMVVHELATNAFKHGALSQPGGRVEVRWVREKGAVVLHWRESGGPRVTPPQRRGFGSRLIHQLSQQAGATVEKDWLPDGVQATLRLPVA
ncbi:MAG TPA: GAF domain-containing protein [Brevundimonas sp.]|nr:GAF domain-containing protein [Brevundimonas sp.]